MKDLKGSKVPATELIWYLDRGVDRGIFAGENQL